jgi:hypothetical protein
MPQAAPSTDGRTILDRITKPSARIQHIAATIYARGGAGKTTLTGTMPGKGLLIDIPQVEGGSFVLADKADRIDIFPAKSWDDLGEIHRHLRDSDHGYAWYAIDTVTATGELAKRKTLKERELGADPHMISMQDWGKIGELQGDLFYQFRMLPMHGIFLAQERLREGGDEGSLEYQPDVSPAALSKLIPSMTLVGRLYTQQSAGEDGSTLVERRLRIGPHSRTYTKVRAVRERPLPPIVSEPHLGRLFAWLLGTKGAKQPSEAADETLAVVEIE